jgi:cell division initiation protein
MIDLTPLDVRKKKGDFRRALRGYDGQDVDDFLDIVADRMEQLVREQMALAERLRRVESETTEHRDREQALTEALVTAQEMREDMRRQVTREAELIRREAEGEAAAVREAVTREREREEEVLRRLRARQRQLIESYRSFLERELSELSLVAQSLGPEGQPGGRRGMTAPGVAGPGAARTPGDRGGAEPAPADRPQPVQPPRELGPAPEPPASPGPPRPEPLFSILSEDET